MQGQIRVVRDHGTDENGNPKVIIVMGDQKPYNYEGALTIDQLREFEGRIISCLGDESTKTITQIYNVWDKER